MGLNTSKHNASGSTPSSSSLPSGTVVRRRSRCNKCRVLKPSCLRSHSCDNDEPQISDCPNEENGKSISCPIENKSATRQVDPECYRIVKAEQSNDTNFTNSGIQLQEWGESSFMNTESEGHSSRDFLPRPLNPPTRLLTRFNFYPGNLSFRLTRANSLGSARSYPASSTGFTISNKEEECQASSASMVTRNNRSRGCDIFPACFTDRSSRTLEDNYESDSSPDLSNRFQDNRQFTSGDYGLNNRNDSRINSSPDLFSPIDHVNSGSGSTRHDERRFSAREPSDRNVRYSRTLSVGRLRNRVLRRTPAADVELLHFHEDTDSRLTHHITGRQGLDHGEEEATSDDNNFSQQISSDNVPSSFSNTIFGGQNNVYGTPRARETRYRDLLEHRSNFLERRRRIRSQVRALQRLGSHYGNPSGHERSCIVSGQHRGGHCSCRGAAREANSSSDAHARASISRIVMLAEALFEVLDEIHQQSVVLSSRPSVSSIGSVPAPNEVVESLPSKIFSKSKRKPCDDAVQCYICLVEYDDGDCQRVLPCHHEFHSACIDKWLKEIHRVCPLCRGNVCHPDS